MVTHQIKQFYAVLHIGDFIVLCSKINPMSPYDNFFFKLLSVQRQCLVLYLSGLINPKYLGEIKDAYEIKAWV